MSGSDMVTREQFTIGMHNPHNPHNPQSQPQQPQQQPQLHQNMRMDYAAADEADVFAAPTININGGESSPGAVPPGLGLGQAHPQAMMGNSTESLKRKRGRPRKYGPDGGMALSLNTTPPSGGSAVPVGHSGGAFPAAPLSDSASAGTGTGKRRGRPRGSVNKNKKNSKFYGNCFFLSLQSSSHLSSCMLFYRGSFTVLFFFENCINLPTTACFFFLLVLFSRTCLIVFLFS